MSEAAARALKTVLDQTHPQHAWIVSVRPDAAQRERDIAARLPVEQAGIPQPGTKLANNDGRQKPR